MEENIISVPKDFKEAFVKTILTSLQKYEEETKEFLTKLIKSQISVLYSGDNDMMDRSIFNTD